MNLTFKEYLAEVTISVDNPKDTKEVTSTARNMGRMGDVKAAGIQQTQAQQELSLEKKKGELNPQKKKVLNLRQQLAAAEKQEAMAQQQKPDEGGV